MAVQALTLASGDGLTGLTDSSRRDQVRQLDDDRAWTSGQLALPLPRCRMEEPLAWLQCRLIIA
ncbi:hypothetical protein C6P64_06530 [Malikia granosa]|uniref:Uncharacterized protein n=1 Tax=Malikia granosa TaxID=263067 RepID=A0A2S9K681_9BURK|nr:hypothetical protein C6P64_06530 [Malikia granosa]